MTGEGMLPKSDGDVLYAEDINNTSLARAVIFFYDNNVTNNCLLFNDYYVKALSPSVDCSGCPPHTSSHSGAYMNEASSYTYNRDGSEVTRLNGDTSGLSQATYTPKYVYLPFKIQTIVARNISIPPNSLLLLLESLLINELMDFTTINNYLYLNGTSGGGTGGSETHTHTVSTVGIYHDTSSSKHATGNIDLSIPEDTNKACPALELYIYKYTGTYDSSKDPVPIGAIIPQYSSSSDDLPSNYEVINTSKTGLLRLTDTPSNYLSSGGSETHTHTWTGSGFDTYADGTYTNFHDRNVNAANHMPPYNKVRLIKRTS